MHNGRRRADPVYRLRSLAFAVRHHLNVVFPCGSQIGKRILAFGNDPFQLVCFAGNDIYAVAVRARNIVPVKVQIRAVVSARINMESVGY